ncbi:MAG: hypothetical protein ACREEW_10130, partial [Caulobacteraceae bacterium]
MRRAPTTTFFLQALGLVAATLAAVFVASSLVILNIPYPPPDVYGVGEVAQALRTGKDTPTLEGRQLLVRAAPTPPGSTGPSRRQQEFREGLAETLAVSPADVVVSQERSAHLGVGRFPHHRPPHFFHPPRQTVLF